MAQDSELANHQNPSFLLYLTTPQHNPLQTQALVKHLLYLCPILISSRYSFFITLSIGSFIALNPELLVSLSNSSQLNSLKPSDINEPVRPLKKNVNSKFDRVVKKCYLFNKMVVDSHFRRRPMKKLLPLGIVIVFLTSGFSGNVIKMPSKINSEAVDFAPVPSPDGFALYFTSSRSGGVGGQDAWVSHLINGDWTDPVVLPAPINTPGNEGADDIAYDSENIYMYLTLCNRPDGKGNCDIYVSTYQRDGSWTKPRNLGAPINTEFREANAFFDSVEKVLYFTSNRPGGLGEGGKKGDVSYDLWYAKQNPDGTWSEPVNLGEPINTPENEYKAYLDPATGWFFFSSDGHGGKGGEDIFKVKKLKDGKWGQIIPLEQINSAGNDSYFTLSLNSGYAFFSSDVDGRDKIYQVSVDEIFTKKELDARQAYYQSHCPPAVPAFGAIAKELNEREFCKPIAVAVAPSLEQPGFANMVYFRFDKADLTDNAKKILGDWAKYLKENPELSIEVAGHTDSLGDKVYNMNLSKRRALSVKNWLVSQGIKPERIRIVYYGMDKPAEPNDPKTGNPRNRRAELSVVK